MANYTSNLKTWGDNGVEYPDGYSYLEGEQPVDDWDNFVNSNTIDDIKHLVALTNARIESKKGTNANLPASGEDGEFYYDTDNEEVNFWKATSSAWGKFLDKTGDTMESDLDLGGFDLDGVRDIGGGSQAVRVLTFNGAGRMRTGGDGTKNLSVEDHTNSVIARFNESNGGFDVLGGQLTAPSADIASTQFTEDGSGNPDINLDGNGTISRFGNSQIAFYTGRVDVNNELWADGVRVMGGYNVEVDNGNVYIQNADSDTEGLFIQGNLPTLLFQETNTWATGDYIRAVAGGSEGSESLYWRFHDSSAAVDTDLFALNGDGTVTIPSGDLTDGTNVIYDNSAAHVPAARVEQGSGSTLDADTLDGKHASDLGGPVIFGSESGRSMVFPSVDGSPLTGGTLYAVCDPNLNSYKTELLIGGTVVASVSGTESSTQTYSTTFTVPSGTADWEVRHETPDNTSLKYWTVTANP